VRSPCQRLYIAAAVAINTTARYVIVIRTLVLSHRRRYALTTRPFMRWMHEHRANKYVLSRLLKESVLTRTIALNLLTRPHMEGVICDWVQAVVSY